MSTVPDHRNNSPGDTSDPLNGDVAERVLADDAPWKLIQKNCFTRWTNEHLKSVNKHIADLETDLSDGLRLIALVEVLSGKVITQKYTRRPTFRSQKLENITLALKNLERDEGIRLVNIDSTDIVDHKLKLILGLIWTLILHYSLSLPVWEDDGESPVRSISGSGGRNELTPKQRLLAWIQNKVVDRPITNFTTDWNDGCAIGSLVDAVAPGLCPDWEDWIPQNCRANATEAMEAAELWLDIPQLIRPDEMCNPMVDELSMMTYLSQFPNAKLKPAAPLRPRTNLGRVRVYGPGLEPYGNNVNVTAIFTVETFSAGRGDVEIAVTNPDGIDEPCRVVFNNDKRLTYTCSYVPTTEGQYSISIKFAGRFIPKSPVLVQVEQLPGDASKVTVSGPGVTNSSLVMANRQTQFHVNTADAGVGGVDVVIDTPSGSCEVLPNITKHSNELWTVDYLPAEGGTHAVNVYFASDPIPGSPFTVHILPWVDITKFRVSGRGIQSSGVRVGDRPLFQVSTSTAGTGLDELTIAVRGENGEEEFIGISQADQSTINCQYNPTRPGVYTVSVNYAGQPIPYSPFRVDVLPACRSRVRCFGPGLRGCVTGYPACFTVDTNGEKSALDFKIDGPSQARIECTDNGDGSADVTYYPTADGEYAVHILCDGEDINGSPYMALCQPPSNSFNPLKIVVAGSGLEPLVNLGEQVSFTVDTRSAGDAVLEITIQDSDFELVDFDVNLIETGVYECVYTPTKLLSHSIFIAYSGVSVPQSPFRVVVQELSDPSKVIVRGEAFEKRCITFNPTQFTIDCTDAGPGDVSVSLSDTGGRDITIETIDNGDNTFVVEFEPRVVGEIIARVFFADIEVPQSPIHIPIFPHINIDAISLNGLEKNGFLYAKQDFIVDTRSLSSSSDLSNVKVVITSPSGEKILGKVEAQADQVYKVSYILTEEGDHQLDVTFDNLSLTPLPFQVTASDGYDLSKVNVSGSGLSDCLTNSKQSFVVDMSRAGNGSLSLSVDGPAEANVSTTDNADGSCCVTYMPTSRGSYRVNVLLNDQHVPGSPFSVNVKDEIIIEKVKCNLSDDIGLGEKCVVNVDATETGTAELSAKVIRPDGTSCDIDIESVGDRIFQCCFCPELEGSWEVDIKYDDKPVVGSPFEVNVKAQPLEEIDNSDVQEVNESVDSVDALPEIPDVQVEVEEELIVCSNTRKMEHLNGMMNGFADDKKLVNGWHDQFLVYQPVDFCVPVGPVFSFITALVTTPGGLKKQPEVVDRRNGTISIFYHPEESGLHYLDVSYNDQPLESSPFQFIAKPIEMGQIVAYGSGLSHGVATTQCRFNISTQNVGQGGVAVTIEGPSKAEIQCADNGNETCSVSYYPKVAGKYIINIKYADHHIAGSPFTATILPAGSERQIAMAAFGSHHGVRCLGVVETDIGMLQATVLGPSGTQDSDCAVTSLSNGQLGVLFSPREVGLHHVIVSHMKRGPINGSPFEFDVREFEIGNVDLVKVYGTGLAEGSTGKPCQFYIDIAEAGCGSLSLTIEGPSKVDVECADDGTGRCCVTYQPLIPGLYAVNVRFADQLVAGCPFLVNITGKAITSSEMELSEAADISELMHTNSECELYLKLAGTSVEDVLATVTSPTGVLGQCNVSSDGPDVYYVSFMPSETGEHIINVKYKDSPVPGSPFKFTVGPIRSGGADKVLAVGQGLISTNANEQGQFIIYTREAGLGRLSVAMEGPSRCDINIQDLGDGTCEVTYSCSEPGLYLLSVKFNDLHVPNSPFKVSAEHATVNEQRTTNSRKVQNIGCQVNTPASVSFEATADRDSIDASIVAPSGAQNEAFIQELNTGQYAVRFVPRENGVHSIHVRVNDQELPDSPFRLIVGTQGGDASLVEARGDGLYRGFTGEWCKFIVKTTQAGSGALCVTVDGPSKVRLECTQVKTGYQFVYCPMTSGVYVVSIKYAGNVDVQGSPFTVNVTDNPQLPVEPAQNMKKPSNIFHSLIKATGAGLQKANINREASFMVDAGPNAGKSMLLVGVLGPSGPCQEVAVRRVNSGLYNVSYRPSEVGCFTVVVKCNDVHISGSPFKVVSV